MPGMFTRDRALRRDMWDSLLPMAIFITVFALWYSPIDLGLSILTDEVRKLERWPIRYLQTQRLSVIHHSPKLLCSSPMWLIMERPIPSRPQQMPGSLCSIISWTSLPMWLWRQLSHSRSLLLIVPVWLLKPYQPLSSFLGFSVMSSLSCFCPAFRSLMTLTSFGV